jgi:chromosome segregation ATPase
MIKRICIFLSLIFLASAFLPDISPGAIEPTTAFSQHPLGRIVGSLIQLNPADPEWNKVLDALDLLEESLKDRLDVQAKQFSDNEARHNKMADEFQHAIHTAENDAAETLLKLQNHYYLEKNDLTSGLERMEAEVKDTKDQLDKAEYERKSSNEKYQANDKLLTEVIEAIDKCIDLAEQVKNGATSLVQVKNHAETSAKKLEDIKTKLDSLGKNTYIPMVA